MVEGNPNRRLRFAQLDEMLVQRVDLTDSSFANIKNLLSKAGYVVILKDRYNKAKLLYWSSSK